MRIAILTLPLHTNYGGILQAYALQNVLKQMGHSVSTISQPRKKLHKIWAMPFVYIKRTFRKLIIHQDISILYDPAFRFRQNTDRFIKKYISLTYVEDLAQLKNGIDAIVIGSDQIWRKKYANRFPGIENAFLAFAEDWDIKRISYAASFGLNELEYSKDETDLCSKLLKEFDAVSVREESGVRICQETFGVNAERLIDPTMLLSSEDYITLCKRRKTKASNGDLMCYILDENESKDKIIELMAEQYNLIPFRACSKVEDITAAPYERIQPPVEQWLRSFDDSKFIVTDSFHACVFSILFHKQFIVLPNETRGNSRIESLLETFDLKSRIVEYPSQIYMLSPIDYAEIDEKLKDERKKAIHFLSSI